MAKNQVKFYVDDDEKRRLEVLASLRHMSVPTYVKLTALGVKVQQVKEIFIESENLFYPQQEEKLIMSDKAITLSEEDKAVLQEVLNRKKGFLQFNNTGFNERLEKMARRLLEQGSHFD